MKYFDLHCDTAYECECELGGVGLDKGAHHVSLGRGGNIEEWTQIFAIFMPDEDRFGAPLRGEAAIAHYERVLAYIKRQQELFHSRIKILTDYDWDTYIADNDKIPCRAIISVEGGSAAAGSLERLERMFTDGVRLMTLTWNADNEIGSGVKGSGSGLTAFGREAVTHMESLDMIVDVSHLSDAGFYDVAKIAKKPFVASHSCSRALCPHPRNLTDDMFRVIAERGGLVGINFSRGFLCVDENASAEDIMRHCDHFLSLGGEDVLCMGSDFDGTDMPDGITGIESIPALYDMFITHGFGKEITDKIFFENADRFCSEYMFSSPF